MPKAIVSAEEVLGTTAAGSEPVENPAPVSEPSTEPPPPAEPPPVGFETLAEEKPAEEPAVEAAPTAEEVLSAEAEEPAVPPPNPALGSVRSENESRKAEEPAKPSPVVASEPAAQSWRFVKNVHPGEKMRFKDGTEFVFPGVVYPVFDPVLAQKILEIADLYHIVQQ